MVSVFIWKIPSISLHVYIHVAGLYPENDSLVGLTFSLLLLFYFLLKSSTNTPIYFLLLKIKVGLAVVLSLGHYPSLQFPPFVFPMPINITNGSPPPSSTLSWKGWFVIYQLSTMASPIGYCLFFFHHRSLYSIEKVEGRLDAFQLVVLLVGW